MLQPVLHKCCCTRGITPRMNLSTTVHLYGGVKVKRRKQEMRVDNPHLPTVNRDNRPTIQALQNLDQHYGEYYKKRWNSMRLALLSRPKYCVVVNNFAEKEETIELLKAEGCINIGDKFRQNQEKYDALSAVSSVSMTVKPEEEVELMEKAEDTSTTTTTKAKTDVEDDYESKESLLAKMSLKVEDAKNRYIDPDERIVGDMSTAIYDFMPTSTLKGMEDFIEDSEYYSYYKTKGLDSVNIENYPRLKFPKNLDAFMHPRSTLDLFQAPKVDLTSNMNYYCMDGGSLLPVIALDLAPGDAVLDMCAGPGGKSLVAMQTLLPGKLVCNEKDPMRLKRLTSIFGQYFRSDSGPVNIKDLVKYSKRPAQELYDYGVYDKILCDVPCFSDRHSLNKNNADNMFTQKMIKNRLILPEQQCELLKAGLLYLKPGGVLVYSTCTLSPVQNEGVVNMALKSMAEETTLEFAVSDLTEAVKPLGFMGRIYGKHQGVTLGNLMVPNLCNNFGPTYFCRITRKA